MELFGKKENIDIDVDIILICLRLKGYLMFYTQSVKDSLLDLNCTRDGLSSHDAKIRSEHYGKNALPESKKQTLLNIFFEQFKSPIIYVLLIATVVSFSIKEFTDGLFIVSTK